jgi:O-antigen/teichoic acid export membrane protein
MGFSGYEFLGMISAILAIQGGIILLNRFYGVLLNAANGISLQVFNATNQFTTNFFTATAPQITKSLANNEMDYFYNLVIRSSKFCFLLSFMFMIPLMLQIDFVLSIWLKTVPDYVNIFCQLYLVNTLVWIGFWPISHGIIATGKNKKFRIVDSSMMMLIFPFTYFGLHFSPIGYICAHIFVNVLRMIYAMLSLRQLTGFSVRQFVTQSLLRCFMVGMISVPLPFYITLNMSGWWSFLACITVFLVMFAMGTFFIGMDRNERGNVVEWISGKIKRTFN